MNLKKIKIILFIPIALFFIANLFCFPISAKADGSMPEWKMPNLQIDIGGLKEKLLKSTPTACGQDEQGNARYCINWIGEYIVGIYKYAIGIVGILAAVVLMFGGVIWLTAGGNATRIGEAKAWIVASLSGLVIALSSYLILYQVNPDLLNFKPIKITVVKELPKPPMDSARSGLDICMTKHGEGIKLKATWIESEDKPWYKKTLDFISGGLLLNAIAKRELAYRACESYCKTSNLCEQTGVSSLSEKCVKTYEYTENDDSICCVCMKEMPIRDTLINGIKLKYNIPNDIKAQFNDASGELLNFLDCMADESNRTSGQENTISSIGDSNYLERLGECDKTDCPRGKDHCQHSCQSCHYGGGSKSGKSYAVDIDNGGTNAIDSVNQNIKTAAISCNAKYIHKESNHIHISVKPCEKDGNGSDY